MTAIGDVLANMKTGWRIAIGVAALVVFIWIALFIRGLFVGSKDVEAKLGTNQADAAINSGRDSVGTADEFQDAANGIENQVEEFDDAVDEANDSAGRDGAARERLCADFGICD